jgi:UPF0716 family protein affecting phage T7 exclusion
MKGIVTLIAALVLISMVLKYWVAILLVALSAAGIYLAVTYGAQWAEHRRGVLQQQRTARDQLAARADQQHQQYLSGDTTGIYGQYPPA